MLLGIENHSDIHYAVVVKNMLYDVLNYGAQVTEVARRHRMDKDREAFAPFVSDYKMNLIVPSEIEDFGKFSTELGLVLEVIKASNSEDEMGKVIDNPRYESVRNDVVDVLNIFTGLKLKVDVKEANTNMCKAWEDHKKSGADEERDRMSKLVAIMLKEGKVEELEQSTTDKTLLAKLFDQYVPEAVSK